MTVMEVSDCETIWPAPAEPNVTDGGVGEAAAGDRDGAAAADRARAGAQRGHRGAPVGALQGDGQVLVDGRAEAAGGVVAGTGRERRRALVSVKSLFPVVMSV